MAKRKKQVDAEPAIDYAQPYMSDPCDMRPITSTEEQRLKDATVHMWRLMFKTGIYRLDIGPWYIRSSLGVDNLVNPAALAAFIALFEQAEHALEASAEEKQP